MFPGNDQGKPVRPNPFYLNFSGYCDFSISDSFANGANRESNAESLKACVLNKIIYPTGGYTIFDFEANRTSVNNVCGGLRIKQIISNDGTQDSTVIDYTYSRGILVNKFWDDYYSAFCLGPTRGCRSSFNDAGPYKYVSKYYRSS